MVDDIEAVVNRLRVASGSLTTVSASLAESTRHRVQLLQSALRLHEHDGDIECPVCGQGRLDSEWVTAATESVASTEQTLGEYQAASIELKAARTAAVDLIVSAKQIGEVADLDLPALARYNEAAASAAQKLDGDTDLANHVETSLLVVAQSAADLRVEAQAALDARESAWAPIAAQLGGWVPLGDC